MISTFLQQVLKSSLAIRLHGSAEIDEIVKRVRESLDYIKSLDPDMQVIVRLAYDDALQRAFMLMVGFMLAAFGFSCKFQEIFNKPEANLFVSRVHPREKIVEIDLQGVAYWPFI